MSSKRWWYLPLDQNWARPRAPKIIAVNPENFLLPSETLENRREIRDKDSDYDGMGFLQLLGSHFPAPVTTLEGPYSQVGPQNSFKSKLCMLCRFYKVTSWTSKMPCLAQIQLPCFYELSSFLCTVNCKNIQSDCALKTGNDIVTWFE
jgi:hypothetical protein